MRNVGRIGLNTYFLPLLLFIGFDLGFIVWNKPDQKHPGKYNIVLAGIIFMCALFILWGYVSLKYVPAEKLINTSIPHMIAAKNILGDSGRFIMGIIVISGSLAAIHALFTIISKQSSLLMKTNRLPENVKISKLIIIITALIIAGMMAGGMAGDEVLETFILGIGLMLRDRMTEKLK